jgi:sulfur-oxidizing protein SoxX
MRSLPLFPVIGLAASAGGCAPEGRGFKLPPGDVAAGKKAFVELACNDCHSVAEIKVQADANSGYELVLGGKVTRIKTYGELVTSIINPSHKIARLHSAKPLAEQGVSAMRTYNSIMTVQQLVDLVTFLETQYDLEYPQPYGFTTP